MDFFARRAYVIRRYIQLQGLELLPLAALFWISLVRDLGWLALPGDPDPRNGPRWFVGALSLVFGLMWFSRKWYGKHFSVPGQRRKDSAMRPILTVAAFVVLAVVIQDAVRLPIPLPILLLGTALAVVGVGEYPLRWHYLPAGAVLIVFTFLGPLGVSRPVRSILLDLVMALALTIVGIGDHRLIVTTLDDATKLDDTKSDDTKPDDTMSLQEVPADV